MICHNHIPEKEVDKEPEIFVIFDEEISFEEEFLISSDEET